MEIKKTKQLILDNLKKEESCFKDLVNKIEEQKQENRVSKNGVYSQNTRTLVLLSIVFILGYFLLNGLDDIDRVIFKLMN